MSEHEFIDRRPSTAVENDQERVLAAKASDELGFFMAFGDIPGLRAITVLSKIAIGVIVIGVLGLIVMERFGLG